MDWRNSCGDEPREEAVTGRRDSSRNAYWTHEEGKESIDVEDLKQVYCALVADMRLNAILKVNSQRGLLVDSNKCSPTYVRILSECLTSGSSTCTLNFPEVCKVID
jgi:hypothetical protein